LTSFLLEQYQIEKSGGYHNIEILSLINGAQTFKILVKLQVQFNAKVYKAFYESLVLIHAVPSGAKVFFRLFCLLFFFLFSNKIEIDISEIGLKHRSSGTKNH